MIKSNSVGIPAGDRRDPQQSIWGSGRGLLQLQSSANATLVPDPGKKRPDRHGFRSVA
jgi:hypothetical protein